MAIVIPGKRPSDRVAASKVLGKKLSRGKKSGYAGLMLTSLVDMFTIIVIFLLQNFSATGEVLYMNKDIQLPDAAHGVQLERAPVISVSSLSITLEGKEVATVDALQKAGESLDIPELEEALRDEKRRFDLVHVNDPDHPFKGQVNVQADKAVPFRVMKRVMFACNQSGFGNINFAALTKGTGEKTATASNN